MLKSLQPIGAPGELCLGGDQLAQGYYRDAAKTAEKFVTNPLNGKRMYKTGDLVMWLPCGQLLYLGRNDEMVGASFFFFENSDSYWVTGSKDQRFVTRKDLMAHSSA